MSNSIKHVEQAQIELLVIDAKLGKQQAFDSLCRYFQPSVLRFAYKLANNQQLALEATQNAWLSITKSLTKLEDPRAFKSWLYQAVRWQTLDLLRKNSRQQARYSDESPDQLAEQPATDLVAQSELLTQINSLNELDKQAIHLFYLEQMSLQEISIVLATPIGTIKSRLNRARKQLKQRLTKS